LFQILENKSEAHRRNHPKPPNTNLARLVEVDVVRKFMSSHRMEVRACSVDDEFSFILYRLPYVVEFHDALGENYLEISLLDINSMHLIQGAVALGCSLEMGLQTLTELRRRNFADHPLNDIFLSERAEKMRYLHSHLEAIDKLPPFFEKIGGLHPNKDNKFDPSKIIDPMYPNLKSRYTSCLKTPQNDLKCKVGKITTDHAL
jgi:hypothetical protein